MSADPHDEDRPEPYIPDLDSACRDAACQLNVVLRILDPDYYTLLEVPDADNDQGHGVYMVREALTAIRNMLQAALKQDEAARGTS